MTQGRVISQHLLCQNVSQKLVEKLVGNSDDFKNFQNFMDNKSLKFEENMLKKIWVQTKVWFEVVFECINHEMLPPKNKIQVLHQNSFFQFQSTLPKTNSSLHAPEKLCLPGPKRELDFLQSSIFRAKSFSFREGRSLYKCHSGLR